MRERDLRCCFVLEVLRLGPSFDVVLAFGLLAGFLVKALATGSRLTASLVGAFFFCEIIFVADAVLDGEGFTEPELDAACS